MSGSESRKAANAYAERADPGEPHWADWFPEHVSRYTYAIPFAIGKHVLDAGTGAGFGANLLATLGADSVVAVDLCADTVRRAEQRYRVPNLRFVVDDCQRLDEARGPFDLICSFENIEHLVDPSAFLRQATSRLARDGVLLCSAPDLAGGYPRWSNGRPENPFHHNEWYHHEFARLLRRYFRSVRVLSQVQLLGHTGEASPRQCLRTMLRHAVLMPKLLLRWRAACRHEAQPKWPVLHPLSARTVQNFPVVSSRFRYLRPAMPLCHYAICRDPRDDAPPGETTAGESFPKGGNR